MAYQQRPPLVPVTVEQAKQTGQTTNKVGVGCGIALLSAFAVLAVPRLIAGTAGDFWIFILLLGVAGFFFLGIGLMPTIRAWKITPPEVDVSSDAVRLGESFDFRYVQRFKDRLEVDFARVEFFLRETAIYTQGTDTYTETHEVPVYTKEVGRGVFQSGEYLDLSHRFTVPPDAMHTFVAKNNRIEWLLRVKVSIARWPDVNETYPVQVLPERFAPQNYAPVSMGRGGDR